MNIATLRDLPVEQRLDLVEDLWDSIAADRETLPLTNEQRSRLRMNSERSLTGVWTPTRWLATWGVPLSQCWQTSANACDPHTPDSSRS
jgi:hypothetical protein